MHVSLLVCIDQLPVVTPSLPIPLFFCSVPYARQKSGPVSPSFDNDCKDSLACANRHLCEGLIAVFVGAWLGNWDVWREDSCQGFIRASHPVMIRFLLSLSFVPFLLHQLGDLSPLPLCSIPYQASRPRVLRWSVLFIEWGREWISRDGDTSPTSGVRFAYRKLLQTEEITSAEGNPGCSNLCIVCQFRCLLCLLEESLSCHSP